MEAEFCQNRIKDYYGVLFVTKIMLAWKQRTSLVVMKCKKNNEWEKNGFITVFTDSSKPQRNFVSHIKYYS